MNRTMLTVGKGVGMVTYVFMAIIFTLMALIMSFISDGPVPLSVHIIVPAIVVILFLVPPVIWRRSKMIGAPGIIQRNQNKIIIWGLVAYACMMAIGFILQKRQS